jgi:hypothetical protein
MEICKKGASEDVGFAKSRAECKRDVLVLYCAPHQKAMWGDRR